MVKEVFIIDSVLKTKPWPHKIKDLNGKTIIQSFYEKWLILSKLWISCYPQPDSHIRAKVKVVLELANYAIKQELEHATCVDTSNLAAKKDFIALKAEVEKLDINDLVKIPTGWND